MTYSHMGTPTLPSAQLRFTSEFGMGSGGSTVLLSPDKNCFVRNTLNSIQGLLMLIEHQCSNVFENLILNVDLTQILFYA
mgnify:CR=1 FL=1